VSEPTAEVLPSNLVSAVRGTSKAPVGLLNPGMFCFGNSAIQMLNCIDEVRQFFLMDEISIEKPVAHQLQRVLRQIESDERTPSVLNLLEVFEMEKRQHDAQEFIDQLIVKLEWEMAEWSVERREIFTADPEPTSFFFDRPFLTAPVESFKSVQDTLKIYKDRLVLRPYVLVHVYRVNDDGDKNESTFNFDMILDLGKKYKLKAVIAQRGVSENGHYISYIRVQDVWYECNDQKIRRVDECKVLSMRGVPSEYGEMGVTFQCSHLLYQEL
jgi:ubiquitin C-terminal hydrolase